ncbi:hypothetical protein [Treponema putidum]|uniref:hypothetical protein n=1 Tax=Treponema putidum TaxID=221027 RepID=UPI003D9509B2
MKKSILILVFCLIGLLCFAQEDGTSPMYYWEYTSPVTLNGKKFYGSEADWGNNSSFADSYREQDGYALVLGRKLHYWLYDTITYHNGNASDIYDRVIPNWVERLGYVIDFDNIRVIDNNTALANSVRALMKQRGCDISVTLITDNSNYHFVIINEYLTNSGKYKFTEYPLYK